MNQLSQPLTIVGIGASAGGLEAFHGFFDNMPADSGMAFVVILHLPASGRSMLPDILARWTQMRVCQVEDGALVEPNTVYVPPPHAATVLRDGRLHITPAPSDMPREYRPIDGFFDTLASSQREGAVGIVLSGTGSDGALGLKAIRACGGLTIAQGSGDDAVTSFGGDGPQYGDMPAGAIATGAVDLVAPVQAMPGHLLRLRQARLEAPAHGDTADDTEALRLHLCAILRARIGHDFAGYKEKTFLRRVNRRMQVRNIDTLSAYVDFLQENADEPVLLFRELLIRVTSFFRDGEAFDSIERVVIPRLFDGRHADGAVRVWVPGCATGEEAYSLGMLLLEQAGRMTGAPRIQVFATDIDEPAIGTARMGRYPTVLLEGMSAKRRNRFFTASSSGYTVSKELREICTFSPHSLVRDPPFSRMDLISCRNLLIYLDARLQAAILPAFHYSLSPGGLLVLGVSETAARHETLFEPIDKAARIFQRRNVRSPPLNLSGRDLDRIVHFGREMHDGSRRAPAPPAPRPVAAPESLPPDMMQRAGAGLRDLVRAGASRMLPELGQVATLQRTLTETRSELASITEEHGTALEELRSANEELHSVNEELQSTNEELETSKEEIQSVNEELHTVNAQLSDKVEELDRSNGDLRNLLDSTQVATVFLDRHLIVRSFTKSVAAIYNLIPSDIGRPLTDIVGTVAYTTLRRDVAQVLDTLAPLERQVADHAGQTHYILRILPYRALDSTVSGTLMTFLDVTTIVRAEEHQRHQQLLVDELNHRVKNMLTVVISLASQTIRRSADLDAFQLAFMGRVRALSASYALLSREKWVSVSLREIVEEELNPFATAGHTNMRLEGELVQLAPTGALALGMAFHELATNAVKYGALSTQDGSVGVSWLVDPGTPPGPDGPDLVITWREQGGPLVRSPERVGFGTVLVRRSVSDELGGHAELDFRPDGLLAVLRAPLSRVGLADPASPVLHG